MTWRMPAAAPASNRSTTNDVRRLLQQLSVDGGVDALVLDLRGDGGGYLPEAIGLTHLFIDHGAVVQLKDTAGQLEVLDEPDSGQAYAGPFAVLVDRTSYVGLPEMFAGAIQDYHRGLIIGQTSFGKGTVQSVIPLDRWSSKPTEGQLTVTIGKFYRVTGESTQLRGVAPDIVLPSPISGWTSARAYSSTPCPGTASRPCRSAHCPRKARWCRRSRPSRAIAPRTMPTTSGCWRASRRSMPRGRRRPCR